MVHVVLMLTLLHLLRLVLLIGLQETLAISSPSFDSREALRQHMATLLVALGSHSGVHALIHPVDLVLGLRTAFLGNTAISVTGRAQMLPVTAEVVTRVANGRILRLAVVAGTFGIRVAIHLLRCLWMINVFIFKIQIYYYKLIDN